MKEPKAVVFVQYFGDYPCTPENKVYLDAICYILDMRFTETLREKEGGIYAVGVLDSISSRPVPNYTLAINFTCSPERADTLKKFLYREIKNLKENGVTEAELVKTRENFLKETAENLRKNSFIMDRIKYYITDKVYTPLPQYSTDIYNHLDSIKIKKLINDVFREDIVELVMKPKNIGFNQ